MDPRARVVAIVSAVLLAIGGGVALGMATDDESTNTHGSRQAQHGAPPPAPGSNSGAADEYELSPNIKRDKPNG
jgi:hypothetical protein